MLHLRLSRSKKVQKLVRGGAEARGDLETLQSEIQAPEIHRRDIQTTR